MCGTVDIACHVNSESTLEAPDMINDMECVMFGYNYGSK